MTTRTDTAGGLARPARAARSRGARARAVKAVLVRLHRYAGLGAALFLAAVGISGAMIAAEGTLLPPSFVAEHHPVAPGAQRAPIGPVLALLEAQHGVVPAQITLRAGSTLPDEYRVSSRETVYVDPYRGEIVAHTADFRTPFSRGVWDFHSSLLLGRLGEWIVLAATAALLVSVVGGLLLGLYELKLQGSRALSLRWTGNGRAWTRRFHNLMGFVWAPLLVSIAASSFYRAFPGVERAALQVLGVPPEAPPEPRSGPANGRSPVSPDTVLQGAGLLDGAETFERVRLRLPRAPDEAYRIQVLRSEGLRTGEWLFFDQYTGERLADPHADERARRERSHELLFTLHSGTVAGPAVEAAWAIASAMLAVFAVTGFLMWRSKPRARGKG